MKSINQPWAISEKYAQRYGELWTNLDFVFNDKISAENFKTDPLNTEIGNLTVAGQQIKMRYKDLLSYAKQLETFSLNVYASRPQKTDVFHVEIKGRSFMLAKHDIGKLAETLNEAAHSSFSAYEIGLYL
jgi:hypothetical protein